MEKKYHVNFDGGVTDCDIPVNFMVVFNEPYNEDTKALYELADESGIDLLEETIVSGVEGEDYYKGYNKMADSLASKLRSLGVDLNDVDWFYGADESGNPLHINEETGECIMGGKLFFIRYGTGVGDDSVVGTLDDAKRVADAGAAYTQTDICIDDDTGREVVRRPWWGGFKFDQDEDGESPDEVIEFGDFGYYGAWM